MTAKQAVEDFIKNVTITDKQESNVSTSYQNLQRHLVNGSNGLSAEKLFQVGSYSRDTIIKEFDPENCKLFLDIDTFLVLKESEYKDMYGQRLKPQPILAKIKNLLNDIPEYTGKVKQDNPCVIIILNDKKFDVLPCFGDDANGYWIPNHDLSDWIMSNPVSLAADVTKVNGLRSGHAVPVLRAVKSWNRDHDKQIPPFHLEEIAVKIFNANNFNDREEGLALWFKYAEYYLNPALFKSKEEHTKAVNILRPAAEKVEAAHTHRLNGNDSTAIIAYKSVFGKDFPGASEEDAKNFNQQWQQGKLKVDNKGRIGAIAGVTIPVTSGFHGDGKQ